MGFRGTLQSSRGAFSSRNRHADGIEVASTNLSLVPGRGVAVTFRCELRLLEICVRGHTMVCKLFSQPEHAVIQGVEPC